MLNALSKYIRGRTHTFIWVVSVLVWFGLILFPVNSQLVRIVLIAMTILVWSGIILFFRKRKIIRYILIALTTALILLLLLPGSAPDIQIIRTKYVNVLTSYEGVYYFWGGENRIGIDCSGLVRRGLYETYFMLGIKTCNPVLIRAGLSLWWHDCSARAFMNGCEGRSVPLFTSPSINKMDSSALLPGDFAVTTDGIHMLAYLGSNVWIEADPGHRKVIKVSVPVRNNFWFNHPVLLMRWHQLQNPGAMQGGQSVLQERISKLNSFPVNNCNCPYTNMPWTSESD